MDIQDIVVSRIPRHEIEKATTFISEALEMCEDEESKEALEYTLEIVNKMSECMYNLNWEKNLLVCLVSKCHKSLLSPHQKHEDGWDPSDGWLVYSHLSSGQVSFHIDHESKQLLTNEMTVTRSPVWDGHDLSEKWKRIIKHIVSENE